MTDYGFSNPRLEFVTINTEIEENMSLLSL